MDGSDNTYVTGYTHSTNFPTLNQYQTDHRVWEIFVTKIDTTRTAMPVWFTPHTWAGITTIYGIDGKGIAVDNSGNAYVTGHT